MRRSAGADVSVDLGSVELAADEDDLAASRLARPPRSPRPAVQRHVHTVEDIAACLVPDGHDALNTEDIGATGLNEAVQPPEEDRRVQIVLDPDRDAGDGIVVLVLEVG